MTQAHINHEYDFFKEMAIKYRKKFTCEMSLIKTKESSISSALQEIAAAETSLSIGKQAQKCQDDVEQAFEELISVLQACKQTLKDEATVYYSHFTGVFDQQKEQLKAIQSEVKSIAASVDTTSHDNDPHFLVKMESTFERINNLQKKFQAVSLSVDKPWQMTLKSVDADVLQKEKCYFHKPADAKMCTIDSLSLNFTDAKLHIGRLTFTLTLRDSRGNISVGENDIEINLLTAQGNLIEGKIQPLPQGHVMVILAPEKRGLHQLNVKVNRAHIKNSPFTVTVYMPPKLLSRPVATISGLGRPVSLVYSRGEDKVLATVMCKEIVKVDSNFHLQMGFIKFPQINEIAQGADLNIFYATTSDNQLHKISSDGRIIEIVGQFGKRAAEFNFLNGLRVSKTRELYVCDTKNNRIQVFDLDLNFKRSFGTKGTGRGQFDSPADVDFDSNGNIYVTELENNRIQVFTSAEWHSHFIFPKQSLGVRTFRPVSLLIHNETIYVTDANNHKVWVLTTSGEIMATFGGGFLRRPEGIAMDRAGFVYVTSDHSKIVVF